MMFGSSRTQLNHSIRSKLFRYNAPQGMLYDVGNIPFLFPLRFLANLSSDQKEED